MNSTDSRYPFTGEDVINMPAFDPEIRCRGCRETAPYSQLQRGYCPQCRVCCTICADWLMGIEETLVNGKRAHLACAEDAA